MPRSVGQSDHSLKKHEHRRGRAGVQVPAETVYYVVIKAINCQKKIQMYLSNYERIINFYK